ncbi:MAG: adenylate/guanylate cyclase domain-containing protein [Candidatus Omnitrophica bacterium]|nr:adenylate/guanylate cyclase domain-containing protein [Candidatus Omnitrophota bacterium]
MMGFGRWKNSWIPFGMLAGILLLKIANPPFVEAVQLRLFDTFQRLKPRAYQEAPVLIVDLDDDTLRRLGQWPWPRTQVAELVRRLTEQGAAAVAFDAVFSEPDRLSPQQILKSFPLAAADGSAADGSAAQALAKLPDHDEIFSLSLAQSPVVLGFALTSESAPSNPPLRKAGIAFGGDDPRRFVPVYEHAVTNLPILEEAAAGNGHFNILSEPDGVVRRVPLFLRYQNTLEPALSAEAVRVALGASGYLIRSSGASGLTAFGAHTGMVEVKIGAFTVPTDGEGRAWLYDTGHVPQRSAAAWRVLEGKLPAQAVEGKIVFIGTSAVGLKDFRATPLSPVTAGIEIHAQLAEQIVKGDFLIRPDWAMGAEIVYLLMLGLALVLLLPKLGPLACAAGFVAAVGAAFGGAWWAFTQKRWLIDPAFPSLAAFGIYGAASLHSFFRTESERRRVRHAFSRYLSPEVVSRLAENPGQLKLGGENKPMTVLFLDIRGFTKIAERFNAQELTSFLNQFLTPMTQVILERRGTIDKYMGDAIMAFWNAPLSDSDHARHACEAAVGMRIRLVEWNRERYRAAKAAGRRWIPVHIGIGINTGECCVGNLGSEQRFDYSVIGDAVNVASRLEGATKVYGVDVVIGEEVEKSSPGLAALEMDLIQVKGKHQPVRIYALLGNAELKTDTAFQTLSLKHHSMLAAYRSGQWSHARQLVRECMELETPQLRLRKYYRLILERLAECERRPPGPNWNGVFIALEK